MKTFSQYLAEIYRLPGGDDKVSSGLTPDFFEKYSFIRQKYLFKYKNLGIWEFNRGGSIWLVGTIGKDKTKPVFILEMEKFNNAWSVDLSAVEKQYRGFGFMPDFYAFLLKKMPGVFVIASGKSQTPGGERIWQKLSDRKDVYVFIKKRNRPVRVIYNSSSNVYEDEDGNDVDIYKDRGYNVKLLYAMSMKHWKNK